MDKILNFLLFGLCLVLFCGLVFVVLVFVISWFVFSLVLLLGVSFGWDKVNYVCVFVVLMVSGWFVGLCLLWCMLLFGFFVYGGVIELIQMQLLFCEGDWLDLLVDVVGLGIGSGIVVILWYVWGMVQVFVDILVVVN